MITRFPSSSPAVPAPHRVPSLTMASVLSSGLAGLDQRLPGGGWPLGGTVEVLADARAVWPLLLPALRALAREARWIMLIAPPEPLLARLDRRRDIDHWLVIHEHPRLGPLAMAERALTAGTAVAVLVWAQAVTDGEVQALQRAQTDPDTLVFLIRPEAALAERTGLLRVQARVLPPAGLAVQVLHSPGSVAPPVACGLDATSDVPLALNG